MIYTVVKINNYKILSPTALQKTCGYIAAALEKSLGELALEDLLRSCEQNLAQMWCILSGSEIVGTIITEIIDYPNVSTLRIIALSGDYFSDWVELAYSELVKYSKEHKLKRLDLVGRPGWVKRLAPLGFKQAYTVVVKEIE